MTLSRTTGALAAAAGGGLGTLLRWGLTEVWPTAQTGGFPWAVLAINVTGSALLAALGLLAVVRCRPWLAVFLGTGVCGGFTTMSTASVDALGLLREDRLPTAAVYVGLTLGAALLAVWLVLRLAGGGRRHVESRGGEP